MIPGPENDDVPRGVRIAAAWAWRFLIIIAAIAVVVLIVIQLRLIVIPLFIAVLVSALLTPSSSFWSATAGHAGSRLRPRFSAQSR